MHITRDPVAELVETIRRDRAQLLPAAVAAACLHALAAVAFAKIALMPAPHAAQAPTQVIDIELPKPLPPPEPPPRSEEPNRPALVPKQTSPAAPAPPPAQAAAVLTKAPDPDEPVDLTGDGFVVGSAANYAGGVTAANGNNRNAALKSGGSGTNNRLGAPSGSSGSGPDRSRSASIMGGSSWNCPFPDEADADNIDNAMVTIRVDVSEEGRVRGVAIVTDPGHGFAREARRCAMNKAWTPTLNRDGNPVQGSVTLRVRFQR